MDENIIKINLVECASELAHNRIFYKSGDVLNNEDDMYEDINADTLVYTEEIQDRFSEWYDYYYSLLAGLEVVEV